MPVIFFTKVRFCCILCQLIPWDGESMVGSRRVDVMATLPILVETDTCVVVSLP